jgi:peroxiredoxin
MTGPARNAIVVAAVAIAIGLALYAAPGPAPAAPQVTFLTLKGETITTADLRGKVVLVTFWATDCATCVKEMPALVAMHRKFAGRGYETIAVAMRHDPPNYVVAFAEKNALPFKVALDPVGAVAKAFGEVRLTPTAFVVDRRGRYAGRIVGEPDFAKLEALIEDKLGES